MMKIITGVDHVLAVVAARLQPAVSFVAPAAEIAHDYCCDGQLSIRVTRIAPRMPPGGPGRPVSPDPMDGVSGWLVTLGVQHVRCVEVVDDFGKAPGPAEIDADGKAVLRDAAKVMQALLCDLDKSYRPRVIGWTPMGPAGGCAGGEWEAQIEFGP